LFEFSLLISGEEKYIPWSTMGTYMSILLHLSSYILLTGRRRCSSLTYITHSRPSKATENLFTHVRLMLVYRPTDTYAHKHCLELTKCNTRPQDKRL